MFRKHLFVLRKIKHSSAQIQDIIDDAGLQDELQIIDGNNHTFTLVGTDEPADQFCKRIQGAMGLTIVKTGTLPDGTYVIVLGKVMDSALQQRGQDLAKNLF